VRCIRRKNVGEALLYAALAPAGAIVGLTLAPLNPVEVPIYESWKQTAAKVELPALFELGAPGGLTFAENLSAADLILTTSLAEGFGMAFLEAWPAGRMLLGRDLPEITVDFTRLGFRFDWLKPRLNVPVEWVGSDEFRQTTEEIYRRTLEAYGRRVPDGLAGQIEARIVDGLVDFGDLDERLQQRVLRTVCRSAADRRRVSECNAWIERALSIRPADASEPIEHNLQAITEHLSAAPSGRRLREVYETVAASPRGGRIERLVGHELILERFLSPARFRPIRV